MYYNIFEQQNMTLENFTLGASQGATILMLLNSESRQDRQCCLDRLKELFLNGYMSWHPEPLHTYMDELSLYTLETLSDADDCKENEGDALDYENEDWVEDYDEYIADKMSMEESMKSRWQYRAGIKKQKTPKSIIARGFGLARSPSYIYV